jgi:putative tricarboxylic transport membrane protein
MSFVKNPKDFWAGLLFLAMGLLATVLAAGYEVGEARRMGPGYFPLLLGGGLCVLAAILIYRGLALQGDARLALPSPRPLVAITLAAVIFAVALRPVGLFGSVALLVFAGTLGSTRTSVPRSMLLALVLAAASVAIFVYGLRLPIPAVGSGIRNGLVILGFT